MLPSRFCSADSSLGYKQFGPFHSTLVISITNVGDGKYSVSGVSVQKSIMSFAVHRERVSKLLFILPSSTNSTIFSYSYRPGSAKNLGSKKG